MTGTNGKSSTVQFIAQMLESLGHKVGYTTTAGFSIAGQEIENRMKMTMPGRFLLQKLVRNMVRSGCTYAVIETSSEGIKQYRHLGINYDVAVFTNLTPEHIESHGSFENYKRTKGRLFAHLMNMPHKFIKGKKISKVSAINIDDEHADYFTSFEADDMVTFSWQDKAAALYVNAKKRDESGVRVAIDGVEAKIGLAAEFQQKNAIAAVAGLIAAGIERKEAIKAAEVLQDIPGRFERVDKGQSFHVIVDYAYEPYALRALFESIKRLKPKRVIGIHGSAGGGRDKARRPVIGKLAAEKEDIVIVTNEDPYDEDPRQIIEEVAEGAKQGGKREGEDLFLINDRQEAINKAVELAKPGDAVVITGKGSEPVMAVAGGKKMPWSDKEAAVSALRNVGHG